MHYRKKKHNLYEEIEIARKLPTVCGSLCEALKALQDDHQFLLEGDVFTKDFINTYIEHKWTEVQAYNMAPHPIEFRNLYSL